MELLISADHVLTAADAEPLRDGAVLVADGTITAVGPREELAARASEATGRAHHPGATLLPGLIDTHVHLAFDAGPDPVTTVRDAEDTELLLGMAGRARQLLDCGVTTVRDLGDRGGLALRLRDAVARGSLPGPRVLAAGPPLTPRGGHCWFLGGEVAGGEAAVRQSVRDAVARGVDVVKVMATGGGLTKEGPAIWEPQFTVAELRAVVAEAHQAGLPVAAHAHGTEGIAAAVAAGVDTLEHCTWMARDGFDVRPELVAEIAARGIAVCPAPSPNWRVFAERFGRERAEELFARVRGMAEEGVRLVAGTDAGVPHAVFDRFWASLEFFSHLGFSPARVLAMATTEAADALGLGAETGRLAAGCRADLLVVDGDPLTDLAALRRVRLVVAGGRPHVPAPAAVPTTSDALT